VKSTILQVERERERKIEIERERAKDIKTREPLARALSALEYGHIACSRVRSDAGSTDIRNDSHE
jgi:hypothetical protein